METILTAEITESFTVLDAIKMIVEDWSRLRESADDTDSADNLMTAAAVLSGLEQLFQCRMTGVSHSE